MEDIQQILQENALLKATILLKDEQILVKVEQILLKDEQLLLNQEELKRKQERILYLERQLFGRRSEKRLPDYCEAQLSLFNSEQGMKTLELETPEMKSLVDDIMLQKKNQPPRNALTKSPRTLNVEKRLLILRM